MFYRGKHGVKPGAVKSTGSKAAPPPKAETPHEMEHGKEQSPHGGGGEEHVTKTHPGQTQPHPVTGVHAVHMHHQGGGKYLTHHHHDGGEVETRQHGSASEAHQAAQESLPDENMEQDRGGEVPGEDFADAMGGVGGEQLG